MRIAIVGAGAMGQLFGTKLVSAGHDVVMIDAFEPVVQALNERGLTLRIAGASTNVAVQAALAQDVEEPVDLVLVFTKSMHSEVALASVSHLIDHHTLGMTVQNGLGNDRPLLTHFGVSRTVIGMTDYPADRGDDGEIVSEATGQIVLGGLTSEAEVHARTLVALLSNADLNSSFHPDVMVPIWEKVMFNAVMNTISAVSGMTVGQMGRDESSRRLVAAVTDECFAVARAEEIRFDEDRVRNNLEGAFHHHGDHKTSMLVDLEAGRVTEVEHIGGAISASGRNRGVETPVLSMLNDVVRSRTVVVTNNYN